MLGGATRALRSGSRGLDTNGQRLYLFVHSKLRAKCLNARWFMRLDNDPETQFGVAKRWSLDAGTAMTSDPIVPPATPPGITHFPLRGVRRTLSPNLRKF